MHSLVYIVLVNWRTPEQTIACVRSLRKLDYQNYRIVLIDNGSADDSIQRFRQELPDIELIANSTNEGFGTGCNLGIKLALERGADYVWVLNNDTTVEPRALTAMVQTAESDPMIGAVGSVIYDAANPSETQTWGGGRVRWWGASVHFTSRVPSEKIEYLSGASLLLRSVALRQIGLFDEAFFMYWEDTDLCFRLRRAGWKLAVAESSALFHKSAGSTGYRSPSLREHKINSYARFVSKHARFPRSSLLAGLSGRLLLDTLRLDWGRSKSLWANLRRPNPTPTPSLPPR